MNRYTLVATWQDVTKRSWVYAKDDMDATYAAMARILTKALTDEVWAMGRIVLSGPNGVMKVMEAKGG